MDISNLMYIFGDDPVVTIRAVADKVDPIVKELANILAAYAKDYAEHCDEFLESKAIPTRKSFKAYVRVGFTEEQAMALILNDKKRMDEAMKSIKVNGIKE